MNKYVVATAFALACSPVFAFAQDESGGTGLFIEPGVSYQVTNANVDFKGVTSNSSAATSGWGILARGGVHVYERVFVAADARYALLKYNDNANNYSVNATSWDIAPVIGLQMPDSGPRIYVGYVLAGELNPKESNGADVTFNDPTGWRVGAGLKVKSFSVNIEWQRLHYGEAKLNASGTTTSGLKYNGEGLVASVSFPFEFN